MRPSLTGPSGCSTGKQVCARQCNQRRHTTQAMRPLHKQPACLTDCLSPFANQGMLQVAAAQACKCVPGNAISAVTQLRRCVPCTHSLPARLPDCLSPFMTQGMLAGAHLDPRGM